MQDDRDDEIRRLLAQGLRFSDIARITKTPLSTVKYRAKIHGMRAERTRPITTLPPLPSVELQS